MTSLKLVLFAVLFVSTSGAVFGKYFRRNKRLSLAAGVIAVIGAYYFYNALYEDLKQAGSKEIGSVKAPAPVASSLEVYEPKSGAGLISERESLGLSEKITAPTIFIDGPISWILINRMSNKKRSIQENPSAVSAVLNGRMDVFSAEESKFAGAVRASSACRRSNTPYDARVCVITLTAMRSGGTKFSFSEEAAGATEEQAAEFALDVLLPKAEMVL